MIVEVTVLVECDECGEGVQLDLTSMDEHSCNRALEEEGWEVKVGLGRKMLCPDCKEKKDEEYDCGD